jgi:hypothetical protein
MREFFHGWRRKIGVMTLLMACVFAPVWVRSLSVCDWFHFYNRTGGLGLQVISSDGCVGLAERKSAISPSYLTRFALRLPRHHTTSPNSVVTRPGEWFDWRWHALEFGYGTERRGEHLLLKIPYWSIVIPLTLLSAYLLLIKPRPLKSSNESR